MSKCGIPSYALFLDLETTGSSDTDSIIEIGAVLTYTDKVFTEIFEFHSNVFPRNGSFMSPFVRKMHEDNGLLNELELGHGRWIPDVEADLLNQIIEVIHNDRLVLAGSGVGHFDRRFIKREMSTLDARMVYYPLDVGTTRRLACIAGVTNDPPSKPHRALADARLALAEARMYVHWLENYR